MMLQRIITIIFSTASFGSGFITESSRPLLHREQQHSLLLLAALKQHKETNEELEHDIEVMEYEAKHRLQNLLQQMDELEVFQKTRVGDTEDPRTESSNTDLRPGVEESTVVKANLQETAVPSKEKVHDTSSKHLLRQTSNSLNTPGQKERSKTTKKKQVDIIKSRPLDLLEDTSWKIVFNIGREEGTWMPSDWGKSGARLRLEVHCTFSNERVIDDTRDPFYAHSLEPVHYLLIDEAFAWPTGVGVGRKPLRINPKAGRYQICPADGPSGTDLLRLMIPIPQDLRKDDVTLAAGNVYGTTGYFGHPDHGRQQIIDAVQEEYDSCLAEYYRTEQVLAAAEHFVDWCKAKHSMWNAQQNLDEAKERVELAWQHYPDHAHMRTDATGKVGLAKEGGLCIQVHTGLAMEYHILGRMEVGHLKH